MYKLYEEKEFEHIHPHGNRNATLEEYRSFIKSKIDFTKLPVFVNPITYETFRVCKGVRYVIETMFDMGYGVL